MPRKKARAPKQKVVFQKQPEVIDSFAKLAEEVNLPQSYKSLLLGIAVVFLVGVFVIGFISVKGQYTKGQPPQKVAVKLEKEQKVLGVYAVQAGDDLKTIAVKYYESPDLFLAIAKANNISNPDSIDEGKTLSIPKVDKKQLLGLLSGKPINTDPISAASYTVKDGDMLWDIAVRAYGNGYKWKDIMKENNLPSADAIFPGMILQLSR